MSYLYGSERSRNISRYSHLADYELQKLLRRRQESQLWEFQKSE